MIWLEYSGALLLGAGFLWLSVMNWIILVQRFTRTRAPSWMPLLGAVLGIAAIFMDPDRRFVAFWWAPLIVDAGTLPGILASLGWWVVRRRRKPPREPSK